MGFNLLSSDPSEINGNVIGIADISFSARYKTREEIIGNSKFYKASSRMMKLFVLAMVTIIMFYLPYD